jgi:hypothetical protein
MPNKINKLVVKNILGEVPLVAEAYWQLRQQGRPLSKGFSLRRIQRCLPEWRQQAAAAAKGYPNGRRILLFSTLRYWIEHATLLGMALAGLGHEVTLAYLPYANWRKPFNRFDLRRQNAYTRSILAQAAPLMNAVSLLDVHPSSEPLPPFLQDALSEVSLRDAQYTLQVEAIDRDRRDTPSGSLYHLRLERNTYAAQAILTWMRAYHPQAVILPNGSILEMGVIYQVARYLDIPAITYEFGEQRGRIWLARNAEVMRQETDELWQARRDHPLDEIQWQQVRDLFASRQHANLWENFSRRWQGLPSQGGEQVRQALHLDRRPLFLLAANVIGDSLTLGRQVFSKSMTEWLERTMYYFSQHPQVQLVVRIHPGERYTKGPSVADVARGALPQMPDNIRLVEANDPVNTYDLVEIADVGLAYTTTVGMEMAMSGVPAIVVGQTHYRQKGFTLDPDSWPAYFELLDQVIADPEAYRLTREQVEQAWQYAHRFFFEYPLPFPWHLLHFWKELEDWSLARVLSKEGQAQFGTAFRLLAGEPRNWEMQP